jgi:hypothetical protein
MRIQPCLIRGLVGLFLLATGVLAEADGYAFSSYGLGGSSCGAGATPPPGTQVTDVADFYDGKIPASSTMLIVEVDSRDRRSN